ncbi:hypothetical protein GCM10010261_67550 [Streptomyces pilosus]|uniref:integrase n=1 Tax=Streptomyces pilosus TaxID=28893 RepID=UPI0016757C9B|nr:integrase [Streptomyces pilosus]GGV71547.1 hypothetical protein GCM10010261_67550 [Streptomyces pilosus]
MDLEEVNRRARLSIRERDGKFPALFDAVLADAGIEAVLNGVRMPRTNAVMERWVQTRGRELLDRTRDPGSGIRDPGSGIRDQRHLLPALPEFEHFPHVHRPHQGNANARPIDPLAPRITDPDQIACLEIRRRDRRGRESRRPQIRFLLRRRADVTGTGPWPGLHP